MFEVRQATAHDAAAVKSVLDEAAEWATAKSDGVPMWELNELALEFVRDEIDRGLFFLALAGDEPAGTVRFQLEDELFWPDLPVPDNSAFVHRLAVRRQFAGAGVATALLQFAVERARGLGKHHLRLDCDAHRGHLRAMYERFGFRLHSYRQVGPYYVARYEYQLR
jgi:GNAT superfamily N-acetyltransferase